MMEQIAKNTVQAANQLTPNAAVTFSRPTAEGLRVMFVGNSITRHGVKPDIGWLNDYGMAASSMDRDYVHLLEARILARREATFCIAQVAEWERLYRTPAEALPRYAAAAAFHPDILIFRSIENAPAKDFDPAAFRNSLDELLAYLAPDPGTKLCFTTSFWHHPGDAVLREAAAARKAPMAELGDLGERDDMKAIGLFAHSGVANHPGDAGMAAIADRIWAMIEGWI